MRSALSLPRPDTQSVAGKCAKIRRVGGISSVETIIKLRRILYCMYTLCLNKGNSICMFQCVFLTCEVHYIRNIETVVSKQINIFNQVSICQQF